MLLGWNKSLFRDSISWTTLIVKRKGGRKSYKEMLTRLRCECSCKFIPFYFPILLLFVRLVSSLSFSLLSFISLMQLKTGDWKLYTEERPSILRLFNLFGFGITANLSWLMRRYRERACWFHIFRAKRSDVLPARESDSIKWRVDYVLWFSYIRAGVIFFREFFAFSSIIPSDFFLMSFVQETTRIQSICTDRDYFHPILASIDVALSALFLILTFSKVNWIGIELNWPLGILDE